MARLRARCGIRFPPPVCQFASSLGAPVRLSRDWRSGANSCRRLSCFLIAALSPLPLFAVLFGYSFRSVLALSPSSRHQCSFSPAHKEDVARGRQQTAGRRHCGTVTLAAGLIRCRPNAHYLSNGNKQSKQRKMASRARSR